MKGTTMADREREAIVRWLRKQGAMWERLSRKSDARGSEYAHIANSQAGIAAGYQDHADSIERGDHLPTTPEHEEAGGATRRQEGSE